MNGWTSTAIGAVAGAVVLRSVILGGLLGGIVGNLLYTEAIKSKYGSIPGCPYPYSDVAGGCQLPDGTVIPRWEAWSLTGGQP